MTWQCIKKKNRVFATLNPMVIRSNLLSIVYYHKITSAKQLQLIVISLEKAFHIRMKKGEGAIRSR